MALRNSAVPLNQTCGGGIERPLHQEKGRVANNCEEGRAEPPLTEASSCGLLPSVGWFLTSIGSPRSLSSLSHPFWVLEFYKHSTCLSPPPPQYPSPSPGGTEPKHTHTVGPLLPTNLSLPGCQSKKDLLSIQAGAFTLYLTIEAFSQMHVTQKSNV